MARTRKQALVVVLEPPDDEDDHWLAEAPAIHYQAQGRTRREALNLFEKGLPEALAWAEENGATLERQPELIEYDL